MASSSSRIRRRQRRFWRRRYSKAVIRARSGHQPGMAVRIRVALILVVDDEFSVAEVLQSVLADAGHEVVTAINGRQGLERLRERPPDLVLLDFMMPIMDGPAMLKALREDPAHRDTPAVVMSSLPESVIAEAAKGMYAAFLRKPFKLHTVVEVVNAVIDRDAATRE